MPHAVGHLFDRILIVLFPSSMGEIGFCKYIYCRKLDCFLFVRSLDEAIVSHSLWIDYYQWWGRNCFPCSQWSSNRLGLQFLLDVSVLIELITS
jgi:hypothetical protein